VKPPQYLRRKMAAGKQPYHLMGAGFAYRNLGIKQTVYWILAASKG